MTLRKRLIALANKLIVRTVEHGLQWESVGTGRVICRFGDNVIEIDMVKKSKKYFFKIKDKDRELTMLSYKDGDAANKDLAIFKEVFEEAMIHQKGLYDAISAIEEALSDG